MPILNPTTGRAWDNSELRIRSQGSNPLVGRYGLTRNAGTKHHNGIDLMAYRGSPVWAAMPGRVTRVRSPIHHAAGLYIEVTHDDSSFARYMHLSAVNWQLGDDIPFGAMLGFSGFTGNAWGTPDHLHFEIWDKGATMDPLIWAKQDAAPRDIA